MPRTSAPPFLIPRYRATTASRASHYCLSPHLPPDLYAAHCRVLALGVDARLLIVDGDGAFSCTLNIIISHSPVSCIWWHGALEGGAFLSHGLVGADRHMVYWRKADR